MNSLVIQIQEPSDLAQARRSAIEAGRAADLDNDSVNRLDIVTAELATNLLMHAQRGEIVLTTPEQHSIEVIAVECSPLPADKPADPGVASQDLALTGSTLWLDLRTLRAQSQRVSAYTSTHQGKVISALVQPPWVERLPRTSVISLPITGESVCGDSWAQGEVSGRVLYMIADGLGHGAHAAEASALAATIFNGAMEESPDEIVRRMHKPMKATRGAAVMVVSLDREAELARWCGVGNISGTLQAPGGSRGLASDNGTVGHQTPRIRIQERPWFPTDTLIMHSDGLSGRWRLEKYANLLSFSTAAIAGVLYRDFSSERDDRTILVAKVA